MDSAVADRLAKLVRMLSATHDGEVLSAVRRILRTLDTAGLTIHDLADGLTGKNGKKFSEADAVEIYQRGKLDGAREAMANGGAFRSVDGPSWHEIACECEAHAAKLKDHERKFISDMMARTVHGGQLTEKQASWLRYIYCKVRR
jgi:hypothetical protein